MQLPRTYLLPTFGNELEIFNPRDIMDYSSHKPVALRCLPRWIDHNDIVRLSQHAKPKTDPWGLIYRCNSHTANHKYQWRHLCISCHVNCDNALSIFRAN